MEKKGAWEFFNSWHSSETTEDSGRGFHLSEVITQHVSYVTAAEIKHESSKARSLPKQQRRGEKMFMDIFQHQSHSLSFEVMMKESNVLFSLGTNGHRMLESFGGSYKLQTPLSSST